MTSGYSGGIVSSSSSRISALTWDATQPTNASIGRYQTFAEVASAVGTLESPIRVELRGICLADVPGTYEWVNVEFFTRDPATVLRGSEGVVLKNAAYEGPMSIETLATTTRFLTYTGGREAVLNVSALDGNASVGLVTTDFAGDFKANIGGGAVLGLNVYEQTVAATAVIQLDQAELTPAVAQFKGSTGTLEVAATYRTVGTPTLTAWTGTIPDRTVDATPALGDLADDLPYPTVNRLTNALIRGLSGRGLDEGSVLTGGAGYSDIGRPCVAGAAVYIPRTGSEDIVKWERTASLVTVPTLVTRLGREVDAVIGEKILNLVWDGAKLWYTWADAASSTFELRQLDLPNERSDVRINITSGAFGDLPGEIAYDSITGSFWIVDTGGSQNVVRVGPGLVAPWIVTSVALSSTSQTGVFVHNGLVYVTGTGGLVHQIDPVTNIVTDFAVGGGGETMYPGAGGAGFLWFGGDSETVFRRVDVTMAASATFATTDTFLKRVVYQPAGPEALYVLSQLGAGSFGPVIRHVLTPQAVMSSIYAQEIPPVVGNDPDHMALNTATSRLFTSLIDSKRQKLFVSATSGGGNSVPEPTPEPALAYGYPAGGAIAWVKPSQTHAINTGDDVPFITFADSPYDFDAHWINTRSPPIKVVRVNTSGGAISITLPANIQRMVDGDTIVFKDSTGNAAANNITINAGDIDGSPTYVINTNYGSVTLVCVNAAGGGNWIVI